MKLTKTKTCVAPVDASRDFIYFLRTISVGVGGGVCCQTFNFVLFSLFSRPRADWPPCKVIFSGWQPIR